MSVSDVGRVAAWSLTWAFGVAFGVALGAYLTVVGSSAAPGAQSLGATDLLVLPAICGAVVFAVSFLARLAVAAVGGLAPRDRDHEDADGDEG